MRAIFEALGARITCDPARQNISAVHPERDWYVILKLGSTTAWVDGQEVTMDVAPSLIDNRTMVPLRFVSTAMGADVTWDPTTETVGITQEPLPQATEEPADEATEAEPEVEAEPTDETTVEDFVDPSKGETPDSELTNAQLLSRYTRSVSYTQLEETWYCDLGMDYRFEDMEYGFADLGVPGASAGRHRRARPLFPGGQAGIAGRPPARGRDAAADERHHLRCSRIPYGGGTRLRPLPGDMMGLSDNSFSQLHNVYHLPGEEAFWVKAAADCRRARGRPHGGRGPRR